MNTTQGGSQHKHQRERFTKHVSKRSQKLLLTYLTTFPIAQSVEGQDSNLWVPGSNLALFYFFVEFNKCIFGANVRDFEIFKNNGCNYMLESFHPCKYSKCLIPPQIEVQEIVLNTDVETGR